MGGECKFGEDHLEDVQHLEKVSRVTQPSSVGKSEIWGMFEIQIVF